MQWGQDTCTVTGQDFVRTLQFLEGDENLNVGGAIVFCQFLNPWRFPGSRLTQFANLFQKFEFKRCMIRYVPAVPATVAGQMILCWDTDPTYAPLGSTQGVIRSMMAHKNRQMFHVFDDMKVVLPQSKSNALFCDTRGQDLRLNNQAVMWAAMVSPVVTATGEQWGSAVGSFVVEWDVQFRTARIAELNAETVSEEVEFDYSRFDVGEWTYRLDYDSGSRPTTQACVFVPQATRGLAGVSRGAVYYLGLVTEAVEVPGITVEQFYVLFGSLRGAQQLDANDQIALEEGLQEATLRGKWFAVGPESGNRSGQANTAPMLYTRTLSSPDGTLCASPQVDDYTKQAKEYYVSVAGANIITEESTSDEDATAVVFDDAAALRTVGSDRQLIFRRAEPTKLLALTGWTPEQFHNLFGFPARKRAVVGMLITAAGQLVRVLTAVASLTSLALRIRREVSETLEQFVNRIDLMDPSLIAMLNGVHPGHQLIIVPRLTEYKDEKEGEERVVRGKGGLGHRALAARCSKV